MEGGLDGVEGLLGPKINCFSKHKITIIVSFVIILLIVATIILILVLTRKSDDEKNSFDILKNDADFIKPNIKLNAEFKLVKTKNGMIGLLIYDKYTKYSHINLNIPNGSYTETVPGLAHFGEHMVSGGSEKYPNIYPVYNPVIGGVSGAVDNAYTSGNLQVYYMTVPYNFLLEETMDFLMDSFRYPLYSEEVVKKEIQAVNAEFYLRINQMGRIFLYLLQDLASDRTSFNGMTCGNNETLRPNESESLSKKLKGYHMLIKRPDNIFFTLYSNTTMDKLEKYTEKYFSYTMHQYKDDEIDVEDKQKLIENAENIGKMDIFDEKLYNHGIYYNSNSKLNMLYIIFNIGKIDYQKIEFDIMEYFIYLFHSKSLNNILLEKNYIIDYDAQHFIELENNNLAAVIISLTDLGVENIAEILLIIYKYIEIIKKNGYEKNLFDNFIKYKKSQQILKFNKDYFSDIDQGFLNEVIRNYRLFGVDKMFNYGAPNEENYNEEILKEFFNQFQYERSFFGININITIQDFKEKAYLESPTIKTYKYYKRDYLYGKIPDELKTKINDSSYDIENLKIREINKYFGEKFDKVVPCYKEKKNKCVDLNEFDFNKENAYKGTLLEENENYTTIYQIDKSSESYIVNSNLGFQLNDQMNYRILITALLSIRFEDINELSNIKVSEGKNNIYYFQIKSFSDNTEIIIEDIIKSLNKEITEKELNAVKNYIKVNIISKSEVSLSDYTISLYSEFMKGEKQQSTIDSDLKIIDQLDLNEFKENYEETFLNNIKQITFKIAGNIEKKTVESIHKTIKNSFTINLKDNVLLKQEPTLNENSSYIINYYQKSEIIEDPNNSIVVIYKFEKKYYHLMVVLASCLRGFGTPQLRFEYSNAYTPIIHMEDEEIFGIFEQGTYKEVGDMEDDINKVLNKLVKGELECPNYSNIVQSFMLGNTVVEKNQDNLFKEFISENKLNNLKAEYISVPWTFKELVKMVSPIFLNPKRFTFLVVRPGISDSDFTKFIKNRQENAKYILNETMTIEHTDDITYWVNKKN